MSAVEPWIERVIPTGGHLALDIGANEGAFAEELAHRFQEVYAFEPNPQVLCALRARASRFANIRLFECAVGKQAGPLEMMLYAQHEHASFFGDADLDTAPRGSQVGQIIVPCVTIDSFELHRSDDRVEFVKIDTEGAECMVLSGAIRTLRAHRPRVLTEIHSASNYEWCARMLTGIGYRVDHIAHPHDGVSPGHCWIDAESR